MRSRSDWCSYKEICNPSLSLSLSLSLSRSFLLLPSFPLLSSSHIEKDHPCCYFLSHPILLASFQAVVKVMMRDGGTGIVVEEKEEEKLEINPRLSDIHVAIYKTRRGTFSLVLVLL